MPTSIHWPDDQHHSITTTASSRSNDSDRSYRSASSAAPSDYADRAIRPAPLKHHQDASHGHLDYRAQPYPVQVHNGPTPTPTPTPTPAAPAASVETYASTSVDDLDEEDEEAGDSCCPEYHVPSYAYPPCPADAIPATPRDFGDHFPSTRRLTIRHDDTTVDGNMNLRVDTQVETRRGKKVILTLFHLRMHDLRNREFSLRRYCRDSGREVCHSIRKYQKPPSERPALQRSFSSALAPFRLKADARPATSAGLKRSDSGYSSMRAFGELDSRPKSEGYARARKALPTNTIKLEFSNYAHVDVKRRGAKSSKKYVFEYWDVRYTWRRSTQTEGGVDYVSFHLYRDGYDQVLAYIVPTKMSPAQRHEELARGGWIPPCQFRLCDESIINAVPDVSDVIVSSGLMALVDDCIKRHFHPKQTVQLQIPITRSASLKLNVDSLGPRRLIDEVFNRSTRKAVKSLPLQLARRLSASA